jgi:hypothetical protein
MRRRHTPSPAGQITGLTTRSPMKMDPVIHPVKYLDASRTLFRPLLDTEPYADRPTTSASRSTTRSSA